MRVLVSYTSGDGHFYPSFRWPTPCADVATTLPSPWPRNNAQRIESANFSWFPAGMDWQN
ncbi:MAG: hypothetical protein M3Z50_01720 [Actinomycetota bacterium]|nr:hypothetical protein [Actinomycetota bacterium]